MVCLGVGPKLMVERPRDDFMGLETLLVIIKVEIIVSLKKKKASSSCSNYLVETTT